MTIHVLKSTPPYFQEVIDGAKRFEWRRDDRNFQVGDLLDLREYIAASGTYTGRQAKVMVAYIMRYNEQTASIGLPAGFCIMSLRALPAP
jgi:Domain of unknown function (DUF3850)